MYFNMVLWISNLLHEGDNYVNAPYDLCLFNTRYADAEECCSISLVLDENNAKAYLMRAKARAKLGKLELAIQGTAHNEGISKVHYFPTFLHRFQIYTKA